MPLATANLIYYKIFIPANPGARFMYLRFLPLLVLLFSAKLFAYEFPIKITEYIDDIKVDAYIKKSDIDQELIWVPFESSPPLSLADALQAIQNYALGADLENLTLTGIELKPIPHHEKHWHYLVKVKSEVDDTLLPHFFIVLMDGKVISALREPESIK